MNLFSSTAFRLCIGLCLVSMASLAKAAPQLNGMAMHTELGKEQFIAAIYADTPTSDAKELILSDQNKAMELRVIEDRIFSRRLKRMWVEGIAINAGQNELTEHAQNMADFSNMLKVNLRAGDVMRFDRRVNAGMIVTINGIELGRIADRKFFDLLVRTWIGPVPLSTSFKDALLAGADKAQGLKGRYDLIEPTRERITAIKSALQLAPTVAATKPREETPAPSRPEVAVVTPPAATLPRPETPVTPEPTTQEPKPQQPRPQEPEPGETAVTGPKPAEETVAGVPKRDTPVTTAPREPARTPTPSGPALISEEDLFADSILARDDENEAVTAAGLLAEQLYISKITKWTGGFVKYPQMALKRNQEGTVRVTVTLARSGQVQDIEFMETSEFEALNKAARSAVEKANPYPAIPEEIKSDTFVFTVPVVFRLR